MSLHIIITIICLSQGIIAQSPANFKEERAKTRLNVVHSFVKATAQGEHPIREHLLPPNPLTAETAHYIIEEIIPNPPIFSIDEIVHIPVDDQDRYILGTFPLPTPAEISETNREIIRELLHPFWLNQLEENILDNGPTIVNLDEANHQENLRKKRDIVVTELSQQSPEIRVNDKIENHEGTDIQIFDFTKDYADKTSDLREFEKRPEEDQEFEITEESKNAETKSSGYSNVPIFIPQNANSFQQTFIVPRPRGFPYFGDSYENEGKSECSETRDGTNEEKEEEQTTESNQEESESREAHHHHLNRALIIQHNKFLPSTNHPHHYGLHVSQNQHLITPQSFHTQTNQPVPQIPGINLNQFAPSGSSQITHIQGNSNSANQNQQTVNSGQLTQIQGHGNGVSQNQMREPGGSQQTQIHENANGKHHPQPTAPENFDYQRNEKFLRTPYLLDVPTNIRLSRFYRHYYEEPNKKISKRSIVELITNPDAKLDVPKTIENIGTVAKHSFDDEDAPMYHVNNLVGSLKDVFLSTLKVPPQGLVIPSQYRIVDVNDLDQTKSEVTRSINPAMLQRYKEEEELSQSENEADPFGVVDTFHRVGEAFRDSIKSSQNTLVHVGDIAHSARKVIDTAKHASPRIILPYADAPNHLRSSKSPIDNVMLVGPKVLNVKHEKGMLKAQHGEDFVRVGDVMDALGVSNSKESKPQMEKIIFHHKVSKKKNAPKVQISSQTVGPYPELKPKKTNKRKKGKKNENQLSIQPKQNRNVELKDFVTKMKNEFDDLVKSRLDKEKYDRKLKNQNSKKDEVLTIAREHAEHTKNAGNKLKGILTKKNDETVGATHVTITTNENFPNSGNSEERNRKTEEDEQKFWEEQVNTFLTQLFKVNKSEEFPQEEEILQSTQFSQKLLPPQLMKPFMGIPPKTTLKEYLKENGDSFEEIEDELVGSSADDEMKFNDIEKEARRILGAVNPLMFEKMFNETMQTYNTTATPYKLFSRKGVTKVVGGDTVGNSMITNKNLLKPFMGMPHSENIEIFPIDVEGEEEEIEDYNRK